MKVTVVIPVYNRAGMVVRAVESVLAQRRKADQIIVVDDGSTDDTPKALAHFSDRIELVRQPNRGVSAARNRGIALARNRWIAFLDSDDVWHPQKLAQQIAFHEAHPDLHWSHTLEMWVRNGGEVSQKRHHAKPQGEVFYESLPFCKIAPSTVMIDHEVFERCGVFDETLPVCEDYDLWLRIAKRYPVGLVHEVLTTKYAGHPQLSFSAHILDRYRVEALLKHLPDPLVHEEIVRKLTLLRTGAQKRDNREILSFCTLIETQLLH
ncbi:MAG: glycosyltransferase family 2 protein [Sulfurospirillum sp.]|nr:MAG: glycosyltransferase family 2 protein [Sulfurospirillum sp.]